MNEVVEELVPSRGSRAATAGFAFAALFIVGWLLLQRHPEIGVSDAEFERFFSTATRRRASLALGLYVTPLAAVAFIWFVAAFRHRIITVGGREHALFATVYTIAATLFTVSLFLIAATEVAIAWTLESETPDLGALRTLTVVGLSMSQLFALRTGAVFIAVSTTRALRCGLFPRWFGVVSYTTAVALMVVATTWHLVMLTIPLWVAASSWMVLAERRREPSVIAA